MAPRVWTHRTVARGRPAEFAWQVHAAVESWTARADLKASILLAFQGGVFVFAVSWRALVLDAPGRWPEVVGVVAVGVLVCAMGLAAIATLPMLGSSRRLRAEHQSHLVYFGHLRLWDPAELAARVSQVDAAEELRMLSWQLAATSRLTWRKHRLLQVSVVLTIVVMLGLAMAVVVPHIGPVRH